MRHGVFIAPYHDVTESPTIALRRDIEIVEWVEKLGFAEASVFSRSFKAWTGQSPREWQRRHA